MVLSFGEPRASSKSDEPELSLASFLLASELWPFEALFLAALLRVFCTRIRPLEDLESVFLNLLLNITPFLKIFGPKLP